MRRDLRRFGCVPLEVQLDRLVAPAGKLTVVFGHGVPVAGGYFGRVGVADGSALVLIELAPQLQLKRVDAADELLVHLFDESRITGEPAGIQFLHLIDKRL